MVSRGHSWVIIDGIAPSTYASMRTRTRCDDKRVRSRGYNNKDNIFAYDAKVEDRATN